MTQEMLDRLIGAAPPSTVDLDAVIVRTRRKQRFRRAAASGAAALAVVAVVAGVTLTGGGEHRADPVVQPPAATPSPAAPVSLIEEDTPAGRERTLGRLRVALEAATEKHAAGTKWIYMPDVPGEKRDPDGHPRMWLDKDPVSFEGRSGITGQGRKGGLYVSLRPAGCSGGRSCRPLYECAGAGVPVCSATRTGDGLTLVHYVDEPGKGWVFYGADVLLRDGEHALALSAVNYFGGDGSPAVAPVPVLTRAQVDAIATDVALALSE
ncbi:hypothetical protein [Actinoplanes sp. L3-i22]|uniref:hypothetical protein n=1 Tax=Actinoplanes sp. L3-i22 TaxID=2836373 RepID=UPI001C799E34|nr:hypothetical protein [Actinoplanes sp. L3-i22]BCY10536.1 hypothetical protein L3i22_056240 [Actinoplanes sp. L3-i22]